MKTNIFLYALLLLAVTYTACKKDATPEVSGASISVTVAYDDQYTITNVAGLTVSIKNTQSGRVFTAETDATGKATFKDLPAGLYTVSCVNEMSAEAYYNATGIEAFGKVIFSDALANLQIMPGENSEAALKINSTTQGGFVIKQIYYAGSNGQTAASYRDQFIEIYNNSSETLYADSLVISVITGARQFPPSVDAKFLYQDTGDNPYQYDWTKTEGMPAGIDANTGYIYGSSFMIPGDGKTYPVLPGKSIVVAQSAINYKAPFTGSDGRDIAPSKPELTVDLSKADFEFNLGRVPGKEGADVDNPNVPDLVIFQRLNKIDMIFDTYGKEAYAIFKYPGGPGKLPAYRRPYKPEYWSVETQEYFSTQIPVENVIDVVEIMAVAEPKRILPKLDASSTFAKDAAEKNLGDYSSMSVVRKTLRTTADGRKILQDTNNSDNDFVTIKAEPGAFAQ
ncbi:MAG: DUF4876 domain-containing protein [Niabella sp.]